MPSIQATLRPCTAQDIPAIHAIQLHFVLNTVITFALTPPSHQDLHQLWERVIADGHPYIAAVNDDNQLMGYAYASEFKTRKAYRHTVELSIFCHPDHTGKGVGPQLLSKLLDILRNPAHFPEYIPTPRSNDDRVRVVIACMSVDDTAWKNGLGLRDFYVKYGFEQVGHFKQVGHKFGKWFVLSSRVTA